MRPQTLRARIVEGPTSIGESSRQRRWAALTTLFPELPTYSVLDLGGTVSAWQRAPIRPRHVTIVNLDSLEAHQPAPKWIRVILADACSVKVPDEEFDFVYSNSLLEHVGGHAPRAALADTIREHASSYWVQTPYRYFPIEPHWLAPLLQFLPLPARARVIQNWPLGHDRTSGLAAATQAALWTELIGIAELKHLFSGAALVREDFGPFTKSIIAAAGFNGIAGAGSTASRTFRVSRLAAAKGHPRPSA